MTLWFKNYKFYLNLVTLCKEHRYGTEFLSPVLLDAPAQNRSTVPGAAPAAAQPVAASANPTTAGPTSLSDVIKSTLVLPPDSLFTDYVKANYNPTICSISFNNLKTFTIGDRGYAINWNSVDTSKKVFNALKFHAIGVIFILPVLATSTSTSTALAFVILLFFYL